MGFVRQVHIWREDLLEAFPVSKLPRALAGLAKRYSLCRFAGRRTPYPADSEILSDAPVLVLLPGVAPAILPSPVSTNRVLWRLLNPDSTWAGCTHIAGQAQWQQTETGRRSPIAR